MSEWMRKILESKKEAHGRLASLSFSEKIAILEKLRDRCLLIKASPLGRSAKRS